MNTLGSRIRIARGDLSQESFSRLLHISKGSLGFYERDENLPNTDVAIKICSETGVRIEWLLTGSGPMRTGEEQPVITPQSKQLAQLSENTSTTHCPRCAKLEARLEKTEDKLERVESQRDELVDENRRLLKENGTLRERLARLEEREDNKDNGGLSAKAS